MTAVLRGVSTFGLILGVLIGFPAGMAYATGRRAWRDYHSTKTLVGGVRSAAWRLGSVMVAWVVGLGVLVVAAVAWAAAGGAGTTSCPAPSPSAHAVAAPSPSPTCAPK